MESGESGWSALSSLGPPLIGVIGVTLGLLLRNWLNQKSEARKAEREERTRRRIRGEEVASELIHVCYQVFDAALAAERAESQRPWLPETAAADQEEMELLTSVVTPLSTSFEAGGKRSPTRSCARSSPMSRPASHLSAPLCRWAKAVLARSWRSRATPALMCCVAICMANRCPTAAEWPVSRARSRNTGRTAIRQSNSGAKRSDSVADRN
jgi:hypothetical protein